MIRTFTHCIAVFLFFLHGHFCAMENTIKPATIPPKITEKFNINAPILSTGQTPLILAIGDNNLELVNLLLEYGADVNTVWHGEQSWSPLHIACQTSNPEIIVKLIEHGASVNAMLKNCTPLYRAMVPNTPGHKFAHTKAFLEAVKRRETINQ